MWDSECPLLIGYLKSLQNRIMDHHGRGLSMAPSYCIFALLLYPLEHWHWPWHENLVGEICRSQAFITRHGIATYSYTYRPSLSWRKLQCEDEVPGLGFMIRLAHAHAVVPRPFPRMRGPGDKAKFTKVVANKLVWRSSLCGDRESTMFALATCRGVRCNVPSKPAY